MYNYTQSINPKLRILWVDTPLNCPLQLFLLWKDCPQESSCKLTAETGAQRQVVNRAFGALWHKQMTSLFAIPLAARRNFGPFPVPLTGQCTVLLVFMYTVIPFFVWISTPV
ncbi:uncharacterized protein H6S33_012039 [Morchella sextelata]|uniref:uncharacterized protein n=1 Tax=Morchella sextelata TaxID=1174677 RepID=UPI001D0533E0|nr:uncharacterized protein H6S33_012039 [Morchella sextelata]KAH0610512.1 hypothetical protein H6S33_012039 [Morchella sextelata]